MIQPTSSYLGLNRTDALANSTSKSAPAAGSSTDSGERLSNANTDALRAALVNTPEIRPEVVARGTHLAVDPTYPPREIIQQLAQMLVKTNDLSEQA